MHFKLLHALFGEQSVFIVHSGRQPTYGSPRYCGKHEQIPSLHTVFGPQGDGLHGFVVGNVIISMQIVLKSIKFTSTNRLKKLTCNWVALCESISRKSSYTGAYRYMILYSAFRIKSTGTRTWIFTFISYTSHC